MSTYLPYTLNYIQYRLLCVTQATYREIKTIAKSWKSPKDVLMRRPATYFATVLNRIMSTNLPNTLNYLQYRLLCVTQATYRAIKVIYEPWKSPKDVLMRRPATYFATYFNWLASSNLPKTLNYIQYRLLCVTQVPYHAINLIVKPWKISQGRPYETSCNIFCNSFKQNYVYKSPKHIELFTIQPSMCHTGHISRNKRNHWVLRKFPRTPLWDVLEQILWQFKINWRQHISQKH